MKTATLIMVCLLGCLVNEKADAQQLEGLWLIKKVTVGEEMMTPVAKWNRINAGGTYESGNGWLQNAKGNWSYDDQEQTFLPNPIDGIKDPFGAFDVSVEANQMHWQREEEGQPVKIYFNRIEELPKAPADKITELWDLASVTQDGKETISEVDPDENYYIFFRWDRIFVERNAQGSRSTGYWQMNGHRPHVTLLSHQEGQEPLTWAVYFDNDVLRMNGLSNSNKGEVRSFKRLDEFPG